VINLNEPPSLLRNDIKGDNHWIKVKLQGVKSNRSAIGARVLVRYGGKIQAQEVVAQSSFLSSHDRRLHFGLGTVRTADIEIFWPSGLKQSFQAVASNHLVTINEVKGIVGTQALPA
jgi:hypothetical protein